MDIRSTFLNKKNFKFDVFLPVIDETVSLIKTVEIIEKTSSRYISKYLIVVSKELTTKNSLNTIIFLKKKYKKKN